jgi:hypothetical protein
VRSSPDDNPKNGDNGLIIEFLPTFLEPSHLLILFVGDIPL